MALWNHFQTKPAREGIAVVDGLAATGRTLEQWNPFTYPKAAE
jgi:hypothetical protein